MTEEPQTATTAHDLASIGVPAETRIYLARHAKPDGPADGRRFLGQLDPPLSAAGRHDAVRLAQRLRDLNFRAIYASDLRRSVETADVIAADSGLLVHQEPALREISAGLWEGLAFKEAQQRFPADFAEREFDLVGFRFPGGESFRDLQRRVLPVLERVMGSGPGKILVVGHKGTNRVALAHLRGLPLEQIFTIPQDYCEVTVIRAAPAPDGRRYVAVQPLA